MKWFLILALFAILALIIRRLRRRSDVVGTATVRIVRSVPDRFVGSSSVTPSSSRPAAPKAMFPPVSASQSTLEALPVSQRPEKPVISCGEMSERVVAAIEELHNLLVAIAEALGDPNELLTRIWQDGNGPSPLLREWRLTFRGCTSKVLQQDAQVIEDLIHILDQSPRKEVEMPASLRRWTGRLDDEGAWRELAITWLNRRAPTVQALIEALPVECHLGDQPDLATTVQDVVSRLEQMGDRLPVLVKKMHQIFRWLAGAGGQKYFAVWLYQSTLKEEIEPLSGTVPHKAEQFHLYQLVDPLIDGHVTLPESLPDHRQRIIVRVMRPLLRGKLARKGRVAILPPLREDS